MIIVKRTHIIAWVEGIYIEFKEGRGIAVDELLCQRAEEALNQGDIVYLTHNNKIVSFLKMENGEIVENIYKRSI